MATSTFSTLTKSMHMYSADGLQYMQIVQDSTTPTQFNFVIKNVSDNLVNTSYKPFFNDLIFKQTSNVNTSLASKIGGMSGNITTNTNDITTANTNIATNATNIATNSTAISTEAGARAAADASLQSQIDAANTAVGASIGTLTTDLTTETNARIAADATLQTNIDNEAATRAADILAEANSRNTDVAAANALIATNITNISSLQTNKENILGLSTTTLDSFAEVATQFDNLGIASILSRLDALEASVAALQNPPA